MEVMEDVMTNPDTAWAPEHIWLLKDAGDELGHHLWCQDPDPAGDGTESIAYVRLDAAARPHDASFVTRQMYDEALARRKLHDLPELRLGNEFGILLLLRREHRVAEPSEVPQNRQAPAGAGLQPSLAGSSGRYWALHEMRSEIRRGQADVTNPAIAAIVKAMREHQIAGTDAALEFMAADYAAAVLDNMPRAEMATAIREAWDDHSAGVRSDVLIDAAIAAARATLLPSDAT
jgi:hypothetical protein